MKQEIIKLEITGMTCDDCAETIEKKFEGKEGILEKSVSYANGEGTFAFDSEKISKEDIIATINSTEHYKVKGELNDDHSSESNFDLIIVGGGSAAFAAAIKSGELGKKTLIINSGLPIGGTCVNVGCVPSKILIRAAESIHKASFSPFEGITPNKPGINFREIIKGKKELVTNLRTKKYIDVIKDVETVKVIEGTAKFFDEKTVLVNDTDKYTAEKFIIATGSTSAIPPIEGLDNVKYFTNDSLFELEKLPESLLIIGGGYIGLEIAQAYRRFGSEVTIIEYFDRILFNQTADVTNEISEYLTDEGININTGIKISKVTQQDDEIILTGVKGEKEISFSGTHLLIAAGRKPNTGKLNLEKVNVELIESGHIKINDYLQTTNPNIFAIGDCNPTPPFVYTAAYEGKLSVINAFEENKQRTDYTVLPWVIFTDPQVSGVGMDEIEAEEKNIPFEVTKLPVSEIPRALAAKETKGFIKLIRNKETDKLIGARILASEGSELLMEVALAIKFGITVNELKQMFHPYLTLSEGIKLAAITFDKDIGKLSCCAV